MTHPAGAASDHENEATRRAWIRFCVRQTGGIIERIQVTSRRFPTCGPKNPGWRDAATALLKALAGLLQSKIVRRTRVWPILLQKQHQQDR